MTNFIVISSALLQARYAYKSTTAGIWFTVPYLVAAVVNPLLGIFCDKYGYIFPVIFIGCGMMIAAHIL